MTSSSTRLVAPVGGSLVNLIVPAEAQAELRARASRLPSLHLSERAVYDLELLANGGFSPLDRFMSRSDFERVAVEMRLVNGQLFPIPVALPVDRTPALRGGLAHPPERTDGLHLGHPGSRRLPQCRREAA